MCLSSGNLFIVLVRIVHVYLLSNFTILVFHDYIAQIEDALCKIEVQKHENKDNSDI